MEKNGVLDAAHQEALMYRLFSSLRLLPCLLSAVCCLLTLCGCSFPRIVILDDPLSPEEHLNLGVVYEQNKEYESALKEYVKASKKLPLAYLYIGNIHFIKNEFEDAEYFYKKVIDGDPLNADAHNNLAWLYFTKNENLREAEALALKALDLNPSKRDIYEDTLLKIREAMYAK